MEVSQTHQLAFFQTHQMAFLMNGLEFFQTELMKNSELKIAQVRLEPKTNSMGLATVDRENQMNLERQYTLLYPKNDEPVVFAGSSTPDKSVRFEPGELAREERLRCAVRSTLRSCGTAAVGNGAGAGESGGGASIFGDLGASGPRHMKVIL